MKHLQRYKRRVTQASCETISVAFGRNTRVWSGEEAAALKHKREVMSQNSATTEMQGQKESG